MWLSRVLGALRRRANKHWNLYQNRAYEKGVLNPQQQKIYELLSRKDRTYLRQKALKPLSISEVKSESLVSENNHTRAILSTLNGADIYSVPHFHMYSILKDYWEHGLEHVQKNFEQYPYLHFHRLLANQEVITPELVELKWKRFQRLVNNAEAIKSEGYLGPGHENHYIIVKAVGEEEVYEILSGHHRACILHLLGKTSFLVMIVG